MSPLLLDTNIVSILFKQDNRAAAYGPILEGHDFAISFMTVAELFQWAAVRNWGLRRSQQLEASLRQFLVLPFDFEVCRLWGSVRARCQAAGRPISPQDAWIAATALHHRLALVTHDPDDFGAVEGLEVLTAR